jgi:adenosylcobinamide kinase/adenosylcobinamide-phosphate guanylyltransferase
MSDKVHLVLGGARSGKSRFAEQAAIDSGKEVVYIATATVYDDEMQERINRHIDDRPDHWLTVEEPLLLAQTLTKHADKDKCLLVDCLTLWLTNVLMAEQSFKPEQSSKSEQSENSGKEMKSLAEYKEELLTVLSTLPGQVILVSNEVGQGIVPMGALSRRFVDEAGWLHQDIARIAQQVTLVVAGLPIQLKPKP